MPEVALFSWTPKIAWIGRGCSLEGRGKEAPNDEQESRVKPYPKEFREQVVKLVQLGDRSALGAAGGARPGPPSGRPEQFREGGAGASATGDRGDFGWSVRSCQKSGLFARETDSIAGMCRVLRLPKRLLRVAWATPMAGGWEPGVEPTDHGDPAGSREHLRGAAAGGAADARVPSRWARWTRTGGCCGWR